MLLGLTKRWWVLLLNGLAAIAFGVIAFTRPGITLFALVFLFGIYAFLDGITAISASLAARTQRGQSWWQMLLIGILGILAGFTSFMWPHITAVALLLVIGVWAIIRGVLEIIAAIELRKVIEHEWMLGLAGVASLLFGAILLARPGVGALAMVWMIGAFALVHGVLLVAFSFRVKAMKSRLEDAGMGPTSRAA